MADDRQVEGFGHAGDLEPWSDAAGAYLIDHHDVDRAGLEHVAERHDAPEVFAPGNRGREGLGHPRETGVIVVRRYIFEPIEADAGVFDPPTDVTPGSPSCIFVCRYPFSRSLPAAVSASSSLSPRRNAPLA